MRIEQEPVLPLSLRSAIELHDSTVVAVLPVGTQVIVLLRAYVHGSEGHPGLDAGSGWIQAAALTFADAVIEGKVPDLPADIWTGRMVEEADTWENMIPIPFHSPENLVLELQFDSPAQISIKGKQVTLTLCGEAVYVEEFPGAR